MAKFDPNKDYGGAEVVSGLHLMAMVYFTRKVSQAGNDYLRAKFKIIAGSCKGGEFWTNVMLDTSSSASMARLKMWCRCTGVTHAFDLDSDKEIREALGNAPFKAKLLIKEGEYTNYDIARYLPEVDQSERTLMDAWAADQEDDSDERYGGSSSSGGNYDDIPF